MKSSRQLLALLLLLLCISCDKDFNTIGEGLVDEINFNQVLDSASKITSEQYFFNTNAVQTNNLPYNLLGYYKHPVYGGTSANVVSQVELSEYGKDFGVNPIIKSVVLSVPYYSSAISSDAVSEETTYKLDSVYGTSPIKLKMYRSNYFLNDFDVNGDIRSYFSDEDNTSLPGIDNQLLYSNDSFLPSAEEISIFNADEDNTKLTPRLRKELLIEDFQWLLDPLNNLNIASSSNFKDFYRGLYLQVEALNENGVLLGLDLSTAEIEIFYESLNSEDELSPLEDSIKILFSGTKVNLFKNNDFIPPTNLQESFYLNGGQGAMVTLKLFDESVDEDNNGVSDKLDDFRNRDVLVNEASLEFYVDQSTLLGGDSEPERIFLYDVDNNRVLLDYQFDNVSATIPSVSKLQHLGKLERDANGYGVKYKINITEHVTDLIRNDSTNVKLAVAVTNNVLNLGSSQIKNPINIGEADLESIFSATVLSHRGTVLYGENALDDTKKLKLKIYYTEEKTN
jgi:hypothetical protein